MLLDKYFTRPVFWDYVIATILVVLASFFNYNGFFCFPSDTDSLDIATDLTNIGLTSSGFILTLLTVMITFKSSSSSLNKQNITDSNSIFELFFVSDLYFETVKHLKNCFKSMIVISVVGFFFKIVISETYRYFFFFYNIICLTIIAMTLWRCILILSKVLDMQSKN